MVDRMAAMKRYLEEYIQKDLKRKIVLITGPRQPVLIISY